MGLPKPKPTNYEQALQNDIRDALLKNVKHRQHSQGTAKDVDVFGRTKEQVENTKLHRAGRRGIIVK